MEITLNSLIAPVYHNCVEDFMAKKYLFTIFIGGRASRKGTTAYTLAIMHALQQKTGVIVYVGVEKSIEGGVLAQIQEVVARLETNFGFNPITKIKKRPFEVHLINGSVIYFSGLSKPEDAKGKIGNPKISLVICDEVGDYKYEKLFNDMVNTFIRTDGIRFIIVGNPPRNQNHFIYDFIKSYEATQYVLHTTYLDLPQETIPQTMLDMIETERQQNPKQYEFDWLGKPIGLDGLAHPDVDESIFIDTLPPGARHKVLSIDFGESDATAACLFYLYDDGSMVLYDTLYHDCKESGPTNLQSLPERFRRRFGMGVDQVVVDSAVAANFLKHEYNRNTRNITNKDRTQVLNFFNLLVQRGKIKIYNTPDNMIVYNQLRNAEIDNSSGVEKIKKSKTAKDKNRHDHGADAIRYAVFNYGRG